MLNIVPDFTLKTQFSFSFVLLCTLCDTLQCQCAISPKVSANYWSEAWILVIDLSTLDHIWTVEHIYLKKGSRFYILFLYNKSTLSSSFTPSPSSLSLFLPIYLSIYIYLSTYLSLSLSCVQVVSKVLTDSYLNLILILSNQTSLDYFKPTLEEMRRNVNIYYWLEKK